MKYIDYIETFEELYNSSWSGAINTLEIIKENNKTEELMNLLKEICETEEITRTGINDILWFDNEYIFESLNINYEIN